MLHRFGNESTAAKMYILCSVAVAERLKCKHGRAGPYVTVAECPKTPIQLSRPL